ncbi:MAG: altronate dehydratase family protein [Treponema sp.]|nr:altronate dehydratase family protein [Treponema sp.]
MAPEGQAVFRIHPGDHVAVALRNLRSGEELVLGESFGPAGGISGGLRVGEDVPQGHKIALRDIPAGTRVLKYGLPIGAASRPIYAGSWVHTHNLRTLLAENPVYSWPGIRDGENTPSGASKAGGRGGSPAPPVFQVYRRPDGRIGIRNEIWIIPTVGCVNGAARTLARWGDAEFCRGEGGIDGVYAWTHPHGCSQLGEDHEATRGILKGLALHPNAAAVLILSLGCENNTLEDFKEFLGPPAEDPRRMAFLRCQDCDDEIAEGKRLLKQLAGYAAGARREKAEAAGLILGLKCGGSDGLSGITANALAGRVCDSFCAWGAGAVLTEIPEIFGAEQILLDRCESREIFDRTVSLIENFKAYYRSQGQPIYENPSPGNKAGGISTLEEKSCGCVQKGGLSPIRGLCRYGERIAGPGLQLLEGPGNDMVSVTALAAAGAQLILFTTGRGTPLGAPVPLIKIASNSSLARRKPNWIDFDAGRLLSESPDRILAELLQLIGAVASGRTRTKSEGHDCREIAIFKNGVTL